MKKVTIIYRNSDNQNAIRHLKENLERIFEDYISVENRYLCEMAEEEVLESDAYIILNENMLYPVKRHIPNLSKVIIMNRSFSKQKLPAVLNIPADTDVLVVNDTYENTIQAVYTFYELGISHLNFIPYDESLAPSGIYDDLKIAITPNEEHLVPPHIKEIINTGYREISFDTLLKLMHKLDLDVELTNRNLIRHIHSIAEANTDFHSNYLDSYLKSQMLNRIIRDSTSAILVVNDRLQLVYSNDRANSLFSIGQGIGTQAPRELSSIVDEAVWQSVKDENAAGRLVHINRENYLFDKSAIMLMDQIVGYCITLQNETDLRELEINLNSQLRQKGLYAKYHFQDIIHHSPAMSQCIDTAQKAASADYTILIRGESGTGKELLAQSIHNYSRRKNAPFVAINCAALPESLLESELFGYEGGAFTGAQKNGKPGLFEQARTGTIFLDEIGDISPKLQSRLLRVIQEKQIMRIGSDKMIDVDTRIIAATNKNLEEEVRQGNFRSDLFYRLNVIPIFIAPLRLRKEDILPLIASFLGHNYEKITPAEKDMLLAYEWPGNVRELESSALYYKTLRAFPPQIAGAPQNDLPNMAGAPQNGDRKEQAYYCLIQIIKEATEAYHGIGRTALSMRLKEENIRIGDGKLREILIDMADKNLITIGKGRRGCQITPAGIRFLCP